MAFCIIYYSIYARMVCSSKILRPIRIRITPPKTSALLFNKEPNTFPRKEATIEQRKVVMAMMPLAEKISICSSAKLTPTARASMLVAIACVTMVWNGRETSHSFLLWMNSFPDHFAADESEQNKSDPMIDRGDESGKSFSKEVAN